jgi:arginine decarboxylase
MTSVSVLDRVAFPILVVAGPERERLAGETLQRIIEEVGRLGHRVVQSSTSSDAAALVSTDPSFGCIVLDWNLEVDGGVRPCLGVLEHIRRHSDDVPVFLLVDRLDLVKVPLSVEELVQEFILVFEDTPGFVAGRLDYAWRRHTERLLPPFFSKLMSFTDSHEYSWHTPGHAGGTAFRKSQVGKAFYDFYGESLFRTDLSVSVAELGSLLDHSGPVGQAESNAARVFGADATYFVLNGTSTANQIVAHATVVAGDVVLADRNCHKSINYALAVTDSIPVYLMPERNGYGIIGPIPSSRLAASDVATTIAASPLAGRANDEHPVYAVVTNSTYDGLCYRADVVVDRLAESVPRVHFDEAWFAYARFHPLYANRFAMHDRTQGPDDPTIFATQSTHKLLAAFSQASMIHVRSSERAPVSPTRFNEAYMMHGSTSPFYPMIACLDVATSMMDGASGRIMLDEAIREAIQFRKRVVAIAAEIKVEQEQDASWFFGVWQPDTVRLATTDADVPFTEVPDELLEIEPSLWNLEPGAAWHGFDNLDSGYCMLDPVKVTLTTPGCDASGRVSEVGIPAPVVAAYLDAQRVEVEKTGDYTLLVLFSIGSTMGKWGSLVEALLGFKRAYDTGRTVAQTIPNLAAANPNRYGTMTLRALCDEMHAVVRTNRTIELLDSAFGELPAPRITPGEAYRRLVRGRTERVRVSEMAGRTAAVMVVPYPPGIPVLMPGEDAGPADGAVLRYLLALEEFDRSFPGFAHDIHGVERDGNGNFSIECVDDESS